ncbi:MAG: hypothetical protein R3B06_03520 [Kofleriaceae bacterium]
MNRKENCKSLKTAGFFRELIHGDEGGASLIDLRQAVALMGEGRIVEYLRKGVPLIVSPGVVYDVLDGEGPIGTGAILTDGEWAWPDDLAYYLEKYHVALPEDFVNWVVERGYEVENLSQEQLRLLKVP